MVRPVPVLPSPKVQEKVIESPSGSDEPTALKVTDWPVLMFSEGSTDITAVGESLPVRVSRQPAMEEHSMIAASIGASLRRSVIGPVWKTGRNQPCAARSRALWGCTGFQYRVQKSKMDCWREPDSNSVSLQPRASVILPRDLASRLA